MQYTSDVKQIQKCLVERAALEQELSLALNEEIGSGELGRRIRAAVRTCFEYLAGLKANNPALKQRIEAKEVSESFLFHTTPKTVEGVLAAETPLTVPQCGNLIRFYGEVIDACKGFDAEFNRERARQISWRYGGGGEAFRGFRDSNYVAKADTGSVWQKLETKKWSGGRIRVKAEDFFGKDVKQANPFYDLVPGQLFQSDELKRVHLGKKFGGVMAWKIEDTSTIGKIDRVFGLPYGADISGTTTDNMHFLTGWADVNKGDPLLMMLPLAAIVGEYHHSLLEVAGAMSLRKVIKYSIGFYTTLLPPLPSGKTPLDQRATILGILQKFEDDVRNKHILIHYRKNVIAGAFLAEPSEFEAFKRLGTVDIRLWPRFAKIASYPDENDIMALLSDEGLANAAFGSKRGALRSVNSPASLDMERARLARHGL
jgi:hypothetical protein